MTQEQSGGECAEAGEWQFVCSTRRMHGPRSGAEALTLHALDQEDYGKWRRLWRECQDSGYVRVNTRPEFGRLTLGPCRSTRDEYIEAGLIGEFEIEDNVYGEHEVGWWDFTWAAFMHADTCTET